MRKALRGEPRAFDGGAGRGGSIQLRRLLLVRVFLGCLQKLNGPEDPNPLGLGVYVQASVGFGVEPHP